MPKVPKKNDLVKFFNSYASETSVIDNKTSAPDNVNYLTDVDLSGGLGGVISNGLQYGSEAKTNIINSMLRQVTLITYNVAQLLANHGDYDIDSTTSNEKILESLEKSINTLAAVVADDRINHEDNKLDRTSSTPIALDEDGKRLVSERTVFTAIKNDVATESTVLGFALDARQGKVLSEKIDTDVSKEVTDRKNAITKVYKDTQENLKIKYLKNIIGEYEPTDGVDESEFLYIWKGNQDDYITFLGENSGIASRVFAIIE